MIRVAIVDDEESARLQLQTYLQRYQAEHALSLSICTYKSGVSLLSEETLDFDVVLMDVEMPYMNGIETARNLRKSNKTCALLFVTNMAQYAIEGYQVDAMDYVVKPVTYEAFAFKMRRVLERAERNKKCSFSLKTADGLVFLDVSDIFYVEVMEHRLLYHTAQGEYQVWGVVCYMKHFALNDQETNRSGACTFANEQSIREIYLRPFELAVREGGAFALMTSYNNIGVTWSGHHRNLLTNVVRGEWGFEGSFITDFMSSYVPHRSTEGAVYAGQDMYLNSAAGAFYVDGYAQNASLLQNLRRACHNILYVYANSTAMNGISESTRVVSVTPAWQYWMFTLDAVMVLLFAAVTILVVRRLRHAGDAAAVEETAEHKRMKRIILAVVLVVVLAAVIVIGINVYQFFAVRQF